MIYIVQVFQMGRLVLSREVRGMAAVEVLLELFPETDYEVEWYPDAFRYMELNQNAALS